MTSSTQVTLSEETKQVLSQMSPDVKAAYNEIYHVIREVRNLEIWSRYKMGEVLKRISADAEYGDNATSQLAAALDIHPNTLLAARRVAEQFTKVEIKKLLKRRNTKGQPIHWRHLEEIASASQYPSLQKQLLERVFTESLTTQQVLDEVKAKLGDRSRGGAARMLPPRTPAVGLQQIVNLSRNFSKRRPLFEKAVLKPLVGLKIKEFTPRMVTSLEDAIKDVEALREDANEILRELATAYSHYSQMLKAKNTNGRHASPVEPDPQEAEEAQAAPKQPKKKKKKPAAAAKPRAKVKKGRRQLASSR